MIEVVNISKTIKKQRVLDCMSHRFERGRIYGLYGENGSGKTMLLRALAGLIHVDEGHISVDGQLLHSDISFPEKLGLVIEDMGMLPRFTAYENLSILSKIKKEYGKEDISNALRRVGLDPCSKKKVKAFSLGMRQRLNIAQAIFEKPDILLLDEPTNALDEEAVQTIYQLLKEEQARGAVIVAATHHREDLTALCDETIRISSGRLLADAAQEAQGR
ncbi:MAG: ABC transporter ATP-binding protein [Clostridiales Family XIII bacterium]|jgi:ABC-2 type transport system ATP-binding protein|nr:ABC transporter ATP-binding protein [Clostridiales Family XIII bacterium]